MPNPIPGYQRGLDPALPRQVLESRLKTIDRRRAEIEARLASLPPSEDYEAQELQTEYAALGHTRGEIDRTLNPRPAPPRHPALEAMYAEQRARDLAFLRVTIRQQREQAEYAAEREAAAGNHRSARLHRLSIIEIPEQVCREFGKDLSLLAEIEGEQHGEATHSRRTEDNRNQRGRPPVPRRRARHDHEARRDT